MKGRLHDAARMTAAAVLTGALLAASQTMAGDMPVPAEGQQLAELAIGGMTCASCAIPVKAALKKVEGTKEVEVNYGEKKAYVVFDPAVTSPEKLAEAVNSLKIFFATLPGKEEQGGEGGTKEKK